MSTFVTILIIAGCLGLILFVLVQNPKGGGLNSEFGSAVQLGGAKRATDILEKGTWGLAAGIAILCLYMAIGSKPSGVAELDDIQTDADGGVTTEQVDAPPAGENGVSVPPSN